MFEDEVFSVTDVTEEIERLNRPSKKVKWRPLDRVSFDLTIPPTVYPPRQDTDLLARRIAALGPGQGKSLLEIGCGSGAISIFAASLGWKIHACDVNPFSVVATRGNMAELGYEAEIKEGGVGPEGIPFTGKFDLIVWNLPYIKPDEVTDVLGPMEEAALLDSDTYGLAGRLLKNIKRRDLLNTRGKILLLGRECKNLGGFGFAYREWDRIRFDDDETLVLTCLWNPWSEAKYSYIEETGSTNTDLMGKSGVGTRLRAGRQFAGKGRRNRKWSSIEGCYAASWIISEKEDLNPGNLQLAGGIAVLNSLKNDALMLKWPNDIIFDSRKMCGILVEGQSSSKGVKVVLGIGINLKAGEHDDDVEIASFDEIGNISAEELDPILHAELASLLEERNDLPKARPDAIRAKALEHISAFGRPVLNGNIYEKFELNQKCELVLSDGTIITDGEDIEWI